jgi:hypothetical protein
VANEAFKGTSITRIGVDVSGEPYIDLEREAAAMLMRESGLWRSYHR